MKTIKLLIVALLITSTAFAQSHRTCPRRNSGDEYTPNVYIISSKKMMMSDSMTSSQCNKMMARRTATINAATMDYNETFRAGYQQLQKPQFIVTTHDNRFSFSITGFVNTRVAYDFEGIVQSPDFITADIPVPGNFATRQRILFDASTSRIAFKGIANSKKLGRVVIYFETDFRGGSNPGYSYVPRLRIGTLSFKGFTFGRDVTTFCDLGAGPTTIDFQGPNAYNFSFSTQVRYEHEFYKRHFKFGVAAEMPSVYGTYNYGTNNSFAELPQRMPDFPMYFQYAWDENRTSHLRLTGVLRNLYYYNDIRDQVQSQFGWGVQLSTNIKLSKYFTLIGSAVCGKGISYYIQDLAGLGLDFTPKPNNPNSMESVQMYGWFASGQVNIIPNKLFVSGGYSTANVSTDLKAVAPDQYKKGQYIFGNIFYNITPRCQVAAEYLYGTRENMSGRENHANRINVSVQYNF